ncbi:MAG TPA: ATP-binding SpoIIE family protein phosphatase [Bryobacteraceae bacterium]|nr:ATP-binding SpoIIE family protein phosphatase [Bryobacteraceae bacterium]
MNGISHLTRIGDESGVGEARRAALVMATSAGFSPTDAGKLAIAVTEAATNVLRHGGGGEILLRPIGDGIEMLALDHGPGIANLGDAMQDGRSTAGSAGIGLGAITRLASFFELYTSDGLGTVLAVRFYPSEGREPEVRPKAMIQVGVVQSPFPGEFSCGDAWAMKGHTVLVADGLGHGFQAAQAAGAAVAIFADNWRRPVRDIVEAAHLALKPTRGAALAIAEADLDSHTVRFCGLGNISGTIVAGENARGMLSHNGTAGHEIQRIEQFEYPWPEGALLVMHTDGISAKWDLAAYPGLALRHPSLVAAILYRDFRRRQDDATVIVVKAGDRPATQEAS